MPMEMSSRSWHPDMRWRSSTWFITAVICYAVFVDQVFFAFILPVLPYSLPEYNGIDGNRGKVSQYNLEEYNLASRSAVLDHY